MSEETRGLPTVRSYERHDLTFVEACQKQFEQACQKQFEQEMLSHGAQRFLQSTNSNKSKKRETNTDAGCLALKHSIEPVAQAIEKFVIEAGTKRGVKSVTVDILKQVGHEESALLISKAILDNLSHKTSGTTMTLKIAGMLLDELKYRKFSRHKDGCASGVERTMPNGRTTTCVEGCSAHLFEWKIRNFDTTSYQHMKRSLDASMNFAEVDLTEYQFPKSQLILLGNKCLDIFVRATHKKHDDCEYCCNHGYVQIKRNRLSGKKTETIVVATQDTLDWIQQIEKDHLFLGPTYRPTLIQPKPWTNSRDGGYWFSLKGSFSMLRTDGRHKLEDLDSVEMPVVYGALNAIQETSWSINTSVLDVVSLIRSRNEPPPNDVLPSLFEEPLPVKPEIMGDRNKAEEREYVDWITHTCSAEDIADYKKIVKKWRKAAAEVKNRNHIRKVKNMVLTHVIATATTLLEATDDNGQPMPFYFPHNLDFRGRAYAIPLYLQPQGDDLQKGLLTFGEGTPLGTRDAADWLAVHGANCLADAPTGQKLDKLPIQERVDWINAHSDIIKAVADDPLGNLWWTKADSPFCFLAFCFEWAGYLRDGLDYVSHLPIAMDGSCNGLQHYSALLRDAVGGKAVNLVPSETPQDIYRTVAEKVVKILGHASNYDNQCATDWLKWGKVDRKFVKRQVMTLPYGSKQFGFREQIKEYISALDRDEQPAFMHEVADGGFAHFQFISKIIWQALAGVVTAATEGMEWLQSLARICAKEDLPITWTAPNGLPVVQGYRKQNKKRVTTTLVDIRYDPTYLEASDLLDRNKQVSGIAPNVIHSLDASAMMLTVVAAKAQGIDHFAMIHDSYGTHAADAPALARITRDEFVRMYSENDVLAMIEEGLMANVDLSKVKDYPVRPALGDLDLDAVRTSRYFFS